MPAYRSDSEAEIRSAVVAKLREYRPQARIIHEINVSTYGPNRIDLIAVSPAEIIACEIKSAKDKLDRLPAQIASMKAVAHQVVAAIHEKFLVEEPTNEHAAHYDRDGRHFRRALPDEIDFHTVAWVYPHARRCRNPDWHIDRTDRWDLLVTRPEMPLPLAAINMLWRDELWALCGELRVAASRKSTMGDMLPALLWHCTGKELTRGICAMLRRRECVEADPVMQ